MVRTEWCFQLGGRFHPVRDFLLQFDDYPRWYQAAERRLGRIRIAREGQEPDLPADESDDRLVARVLIGLLQRGDASIVSPWLEREVLEHDLDLFPIESIQGLGWQFDLAKVNELTPAGLLVALTSSAERVSVAELGPFDSQAERDFFFGYLRTILGPAMAYLDLQRPLHSMVDVQGSRDVAREQRVDFALQTPSGLKIVFEVDGQQHRGRQHAMADRVRDERLRRSGWHVARITTDRLHAGGNLFSSDTLALIQNDPVVQISKATQISQTELKLARVPHEINRTQMAVLLALFNGDLSLADEVWTILSVDRDHRGTELAAIDLHRTMQKFCALYGLADPPPIHLLRVVNPSLASTMSPKYQHVIPIGISRDALTLETASIIINVSASERTIDMVVDDGWSVDARHLPTQTPVYTVTTASPYEIDEQLPWVPARPIAEGHESTNALGFFLQYLFRRKEFRPMQLPIIQRAMSRRDVLGLLPTGGGKSLTFQMATLLSPGIAIVVAPTKSLIDDQVFNLHVLGINRVEGIHSGKTADQKSRSLASIATGGPRFVYIAPERFQSEPFRQELRESAIRHAVVFGVVDEAHCVSEWGHQFRPSYLMVGHHARTMFAPPDQRVPLMALTATASTTVLADIQRELGFETDDSASVVEVLSHARDNLNYVPIHRPDHQKESGLLEALARVSERLDMSQEDLTSDPQTAGLVFCRYVNGPYGVDGVHNLLGNVVSPAMLNMYSGSVPKSRENLVNWEQHKAHVQRAYKMDKFPVLVTTSAFGMGVDKGNIRYTIHYGLPDSTEALVQESGRCGRDGRDAVCAIVYSPAPNGNQILNPEIDADTVRKLTGGFDNPSDARRVLYLNSLSYPGVKKELASLQHAYQQVRTSWTEDSTPLGHTSLVALKSPPKGWDALEKAIYRLSVLGIITDYTIDWTSRIVHAVTHHISSQELAENLVAYFNRYPNAQFSRATNVTSQILSNQGLAFETASSALIEFTYDQLERARRQALFNLVGFIEESKADGEKLRSLITGFLTRNSFTDIARNLSSDPDENRWFDVLDLAKYERDRRELAQAVQRQLESEANHPGLRLVYLISSASDEAFSPEDVTRELSTVVSDYQQDRSRTGEDLDSLLLRTTTSLEQFASDDFDEIVLALSRYAWSEPMLVAAHDRVKGDQARAVCALPALRAALNQSRNLYATVESGD